MIRNLVIAKTLRLVVVDDEKAEQSTNQNRKESNNMENVTQKYSNDKLLTLANDKARAQNEWASSPTLQEEFQSFETMWSFITHLGQSTVLGDKIVQGSTGLKD